jgi:hypothetical protein
MTERLPYLWPRLTTCLTIRNVKPKADIVVEPRRLGSTGTPHDIRDQNGHYGASSPATAHDGRCGCPARRATATAGDDYLSHPSGAGTCPCLAAPVGPRPATDGKQRAHQTVCRVAIVMNDPARRTVPDASTINTRAAHRRLPQKISTRITRTTRRYPAHGGTTATAAPMDPRFRGSPDQPAYRRAGLSNLPGDGG